MSYHDLLTWFNILLINEQMKAIESKMLKIDLTNFKCSWVLAVMLGVLLLMAILFSCKPTYSLYSGLHDDQISNHVMVTKVDTLNRQGFDSLCVAEEIPSDIALWQGSYYKDYETNAKRIKYVWLKIDDREDEVISDATYVLRVNVDNGDSTFVTTKRTVIRK